MSATSLPAAAADLPATLPVFPLVGVLLLPRGSLPLNVFEPRYLNLTEAVLGAGRMMGVVQPASDGQSGMSAGDDATLHNIGCAGRIVSFQESDDGRFVIQLKGVCRFRIAEELAMVDGYRRVAADYQPFEADLRDTADAIDRERLTLALRTYFEQRQLDADWSGLDGLPDEALVNMMAMLCPFPPADKQALLESPTLAGRAKLLVGLMEAESLGPAAEIRH